MPELFAKPYYLLQGQAALTTNWVQPAEPSNAPATGNIANIGGVSRLSTVYCTFGPGTTAGVVTLETSPDPNFAGTWAPLLNQQGNPITFTWATGNTGIMSATAAGPYFSIRARVSTAIVGGTVDCRLEVLT